MLAAGLVIVIVAIFLVYYWNVRAETEESTSELTPIESIPESLWKNLAEKRVFFGHQSVGRNLIEGIMDVMAERPEIKLNIVESADLGSIEGAAFVHCNVGRNTQPNSKLTGFRQVLESGGEQATDIALLKFCYVDIGRDSDAQEIFGSYHRAFSELGERFRDTTFVHFTVPIQSGPVGVKGVIKESIKPVVRRPTIVEKNSVRQRYNEILRSSFLGRQPVFDIAGYEAIGPEGLMSYRISGSEKVYFMDAQYSDDGGHLNKRGRKHVAEQLLVTLARAAED